MPNISDWKFCKVKRGDKVPYPANWQNNPLSLQQIPAGDNYGLLTGVHSGIIALDFDGAWAWEWWATNMNNMPLPETIAWSSGRADRIQMAYKVPQELWPHIKTYRRGNGVPKPDTEGIEFRWNGLQSVLPPSIHPDTGKPYEWMLGEEAVECPIEILEFLVEVSAPVKTTPNNQVSKIITDDSPELKELDSVMTAFRRHYPNMGYDLWRNVTWACINFVGPAAGIAVMNTFYPEQSKGEYNVLATKYKNSESPTIASLIHMVRLHEPDYGKLKQSDKRLQDIMKKWSIRK